MTTPDDHHGGVPTRHIRIAAVAGGAVLIVGLAVAIGTASGSGPASHPSATTAPSTSAARVPPPVASGPPAPTGAPSPSPAHPVVRWHGAVTVSGPDAHKDLDSIPPQTYQRDADINGDWLKTTLSPDGSGVQLALLKSGTSPGFAACRDAVLANGNDSDVDVQTGDTLCVLTSQGRVALLRTTRATQTSTDPIDKFTVTVWDPPQRPGAG